nr:hypothetical protein [Tanacetum cinerariifolium]
EAVRKELGDSLVRVATTASSLEAEQDSGAGPRCQETMRDTTAQTSFESVSKHFNDHCSQERNRSRTHKLKRLYKVGLIARVESSDNEESLGKDASKQRRRIVAIDVDNEITLVNDADNEMFDVDDLGGEEVFIAEQEVAKINDDHQLSKTMQAKEQEELCDAKNATLFQQLLGKRRKYFAAKSAEEKRNKPPTQAQKRKVMCTYLKNMEAYKLKDLKLKEFDKI